ncbi:hypothetical protein D3C80_1647580 [compost metagenome]
MQQRGEGTDQDIRTLHPGDQQSRIAHTVCMKPVMACGIPAQLLFGKVFGCCYPLLIIHK